MTIRGTSGSLSGSTNISLAIAGTNSTATVTIVHPAMGFSVLPGSVRRLYATVTGGVTNGVTWTVSGGGVLS
ncbi:MAG TPA: hypothetical protein VMV57_14715, partial [Terracidiphilus sp.]|nr:hypothetical protein [Terracidiphilus sp.]